MARSHKEHSTLARITQEEAQEFRFIYIASFVVFLAIAVIARVLPKQWGRGGLADAQGHLSIIGEAKAAANTFVPFAFMG